MNRHTKIAIFIAPFLVVGGYIAADYYAQEQTNNRNIFELSLEGHCNLLKNPCTLKNKQLTLTLSNKNNITQVKSNHSLEKMLLSSVDKNNIEIQYQMSTDADKQLWHSKTSLTPLLRESSELKIRIIGFVNKGYYFSEFYSRAQNNGY
ncbi:MAG: hypothetical protein GY694_05365 [Gammaproteobacteria bacterium]|nr:hypothetical protein [Gammaproteobacteria bacterium]